MSYRFTLLAVTLLATGCDNSANIGPLNELSGLAAAAEPSYYWALNDGPNKPGDPVDSTLYLVDGAGAVVGTVNLNVPNRDWEDIARMDDADQAFLVVADTGDNRGVHLVYRLHLVPLPGMATTAQSAPVTRTIDFTFPSGPLDCEAVAYDPKTKNLVLVSKRETPPAVYRLPADAPSGETHVAERIGEIRGLETATWWERLLHPFQGPYAAQPTALDISADGRTVALLTYKNVYVWRRDSDLLFDSNPTIIALPSIGQWEAIVLGQNEAVIGREGTTNLYVMRLPSK